MFFRKKTTKRAEKRSPILDDFQNRYDAAMQQQDAGIRVLDLKKIAGDIDAIHNNQETVSLERGMCSFMLSGTGGLVAYGYLTTSVILPGSAVLGVALGPVLIPLAAAVGAASVPIAAYRLLESRGKQFLLAVNEIKKSALAEVDRVIREDVRSLVVSSKAAEVLDTFPSARNAFVLATARENIEAIPVDAKPNLSASGKSFRL